ncbi:MAG TPA: DUF5666 domain-containing protein [Vicinamibacterales bacterium]|nr:DUF5666 domain-containing protein [Vicinamibacterales bacterium]
MVQAFDGEHGDDRSEGIGKPESGDALGEVLTSGPPPTRLWNRGNRPGVGQGRRRHTVSALDTAAATFVVGTQRVHVPVTATIRHGDRVLALTDLRDGDHVEVRGTLSGSTLEAAEVKVEQEGD